STRRWRTRTSPRSTVRACSAGCDGPSVEGPLIRLAVRCAPEQADPRRPELTVLAPNGVEEERGPGYVEYAIYGGEGELPELGEIDAVLGGGRDGATSAGVTDDS